MIQILPNNSPPQSQLDIASPSIRKQTTGILDRFHTSNKSPWFLNLSRWWLLSISAALTTRLVDKRNQSNAYLVGHQGCSSDVRDWSLHSDLTFWLQIKLSLVSIVSFGLQGLRSYAQEASPEDNLQDFGDWGSTFSECCGTMPNCASKEQLQQGAYRPAVEIYSRVSFVYQSLLNSYFCEMSL